MEPKYNTNSPYWFGMRHDGSAPKSLGFFGPQPVGNGDMATEYSIGVDLNGKRQEIPTLVPTLTLEEFMATLNAAGGRGELPDGVVKKAVDHARFRTLMGQPPFWRIPEKQHAPPKGLLY